MSPPSAAVDELQFADAKLPKVQQLGEWFSEEEPLDNDEPRVSPEHSRFSIAAKPDVLLACGAHLELLGSALQASAASRQRFAAPHKAPGASLASSSSVLAEALQELLHGGEARARTPDFGHLSPTKLEVELPAPMRESQAAVEVVHLKQVFISDPGVTSQEPPEGIRRSGTGNDSTDFPQSQKEARALARSKNVTKVDSQGNARSLDLVAADISHVKKMDQIEQECVSEMRKSNSHTLKKWKKSRTKAQQKDEPRTFLQRIHETLADTIESNRFESLVASAIFFNAVMIGVQANWSVLNPGQATPRWMTMSEYVTVGFFTLELLLRIVVYRRKFVNYKSDNFFWNMFDSVLVVSAYFEVVAAATGAQIVRTNVTRLFRLSRLMRAVRVVRIVRFFSELRVMVLAIGSSLRLLLWASILLMMLIYLFAVFFLQIVEEEFIIAEQTPEQAFPRIGELKHYWGDLPTGMYTLYASITSGNAWTEAAEPLLDISLWLGVSYCVYIAIAVFCVLNTVTGIFVDKANQISSRDEDLRLWSEMDKRKKWIAEVKELFREADLDNTGVLAYDEFVTQLEDARIQDALKNLGVDVIATEPDTLFELFDFDGGGTIDINEFATALQRMHGTANAVDVAALKFGLKFANDSIKEIRSAMNMNQDVVDSWQAVRTGPSDESEDRTAW